LLPAEIKYVLDNYDPEDISISITRADFSGEMPVFNFTIYGLDDHPQNWTLEVAGHRTSELLFTSYISDTEIHLTDDHPFLWQYSDIQSELFFNGSSPDIYRIISELNQIDFQLFGKYQHSSEQLYTLLRSSNGSLGKGSKKLLTMYKECLNKYGIKASIVGEYSPTYNDGKNKFNGETLKIFLIGGSYIVGQDFIFTRTN
jgi:hypothetical protein